MPFSIEKSNSTNHVDNAASADLSASLWSASEAGIAQAKFVDHPKEGYYVDNGVRADYDKRTGIPYRIENGNGTCTFSYPGGGGEYFAPCKSRKHK